MILAITNIQLCKSAEIIQAAIADFMIPGQPIGVMIFKVYSTVTLGQAYVPVSSPIKSEF